MNNTQIILRDKVMEFPMAVNVQAEHIMDLHGPRPVRAHRRRSEVFFRLGYFQSNSEPTLDELTKQPREVTQAFLDIGSVEDAARFLGKYGPLLLPDPNVPDTANDPCTVKWSDLLKIQNDLRKMWATSPGKWHEISMEYLRKLETFYMDLHFDFRRDPPILVTMSSSVGEALINDVIFSALSGLESGFCARYDCQKLFQKTSKHDRKYCSTECAHVESVRKHRERKSTGKKKGK